MSLTANVSGTALPASAATTPNDAVAATLTSSAINLRRLVSLRMIAIAVEVLVVVVAARVLEILLPREPVALLLSSTALLNLCTWLRLRRAWPVRDIELFAHLVLDVLLLTALLYFCGGSTNPFAPLYLLPLTLTAAALPWRYTWPMLLLTSSCYSLLLFYYVPLLHSHRGAPAHVLDDFKVHVVGTWLGFLLGGGLIAYFAVRMRETLRERDSLRSRMREQELRTERMLALGTFATGAAHELGTPLATIAVLSKELHGSDERDARRLQVLREQVERCKDILGSLSAAVGASRAEGGSAVVLDDYLREVFGRWQELHPQVQAHIRVQGTVAAPRMVIDRTLSQAFLNVLNNAAEVSAVVDVAAEWNETTLVLVVRDHGPGLAPQVQEHIGEPFFTTKEPGAGMGLGLYLARSTLERLGGELSIENQPEGGALARLCLPLQHYRIDPI